MFLMPINRIIKIHRFILIITTDFYCRLNSAAWVECKFEWNNVKSVYSRLKRWTANEKNNQVRIDLSSDYKSWSGVYAVLDIAKCIRNCGARSFTKCTNIALNTLTHTFRKWCKLLHAVLLICLHKMMDLYGGAVWACVCVCAVAFYRIFLLMHGNQIQRDKRDMWFIIRGVTLQSKTLEHVCVCVCERLPSHCLHTGACFYTRVSVCVCMDEYVLRVYSIFVPW